MHFIETQNTQFVSGNGAFTAFFHQTQNMQKTNTDRCQFEGVLNNFTDICLFLTSLKNLFLVFKDKEY